MNNAFRDWIIEKTKSYPEDVKQNLLRMLKFEPDRVMQNIVDNLMAMSMTFAAETRRINYVDSTKNPQEILQALQQHYAAEIAAIPDEAAQQRSRP